MKKIDIKNERYDYRISSDNLYAPLEYGENRLYQIGRIHCHAHTVIPTHPQLNYIEFTVAVDGQGTVITNGERIPISAGDIYLSFVSDFHAIETDAVHPLKFDFLTVQTENESMKKAFDELIATHRAPNSRIIRSELVRRLIADAIKEVSAPDEFSDRVLCAILDRLLISVIRAFSPDTPQDVFDDTRDRKLVCLKLMNYIDNHIYTIKTLRELEGVMNYTYNYMSNLFKAETGTTLQEYLCERRFEAARLLLRDGQFSVGHVAELLGYSSVYSFSLAFKRRFGYSPVKEKTKKFPTQHPCKEKDNML